MPIVTLAQLRGRARGRRGKDRSRGRGRGNAQQEPEPESKRRFQGPSHSLTGEGPQNEGHDHAQRGLGVFAKVPRGTYEDAVEHLQQIQDDAAINDLMEKLDAYQAEAEEEKHAQEPPTRGLDGRKAMIEQQPSKQKEAAQGSEVIDLCDSDAEDPAPFQQQPKRSCPADRQPTAPTPAVASTTGRAHPQGRSAQQRDRNLGGRAGGPSSSSWMYGGEGAYVPDPNAASDMRLRLNETVHVLDAGLIRHPAHALLDSGNAGCTLIKAALARQLGLVDQSGWPTQAGRRSITVRGVVAGASEKVPLINLTYELRGKTMRVTVGVTNASLGCDLLISQREISEFVSDGFIFDVR